MWEGRGIKERIDREVGNTRWRLSFPEASVFHLPAFKSDRNALLLQFDSDRTNHNVNRPFRFYANWLADESFMGVVQQAWQGSPSWQQAVNNLQEAATTWNRDCYGNLFHRKRRLMALLEGATSRMVMGENRHLEKLKKKLWSEYIAIVSQEELFWC